jgi:hypothetical protein
MSPLFYSLGLARLTLGRVVEHDLADGNLASLANFTRGVIKVRAEGGEGGLGRDGAEGLGSLVTDHGAVAAIGVDEDVFEDRDGVLGLELAEDVGELVLEEGRVVSEACSVSNGN